MIKCRVKISKIMYPKNKQLENGDYAIFVVSILNHISGSQPITHKFFKTVSLRGNVPAIQEGDIYTMIFNNPNTNEYGTTYEVVNILTEINPLNKEEVMGYLKLMCGETLAREMIKVENVYFMLRDKNNKELLKIKGIKESRLEQIYKKMDSLADNSVAHVALQPLGLTVAQINKICLAVGGADSAIKICKTEPYSLIKKVKGFGFKMIDEIALKCGFNPFSPMRIISAIEYIMSEHGESGKSFLYSEQLIQELRKIVATDLCDINTIVYNMVTEGLITISEDGKMVALPYYINLEKEIASEIIRINKAKSTIEIPENWMEQVREIEKKQGWEHTEEQLQGIKMVLENNITVVSGKAGSGKSTVTNAMSFILNNYSVALCCLSAKASQRLREVTGLEAHTIHKLLKIGSEDELSEIYEDVLIVDEASMISGSLFIKILRAIRNGSKIIILGDDGQLTAIGNCSVFSDLISSKVVPHIELTKIHRQAEKSAIITKSIDFREQRKICDDSFAGCCTLGELKDLDLYIIDKETILQQAVTDFFDEYNKSKNILEVQIITALKTRGDLSIANINLSIQSLITKQDGEYFTGFNKIKIYVGDKVINSKNDYNITMSESRKKVGMWNGSIGIVKAIKEKCAIIDFVGIGELVVPEKNYTNINLAYAITCHSSQGSQWESVICAFDMSAFTLLNVELVYTAITRASLHCKLMMDRKSFNFASKNVEQKTKQTLLSHFLQSA